MVNLQTNVQMNVVDNKRLAASEVLGILIDENLNWKPHITHFSCSITQSKSGSLHRALASPYLAYRDLGPQLLEFPFISIHSIEKSNQDARKSRTIKDT